MEYAQARKNPLLIREICLMLARNSLLLLLLFLLFTYVKQSLEIGPLSSADLSCVFLFYLFIISTPFVLQDLLAVGYSQFGFTEQKGGLACCWSLKNPEVRTLFSF